MKSASEFLVGFRLLDLLLALSGNLLDARLALDAELGQVFDDFLQGSLAPFGVIIFGFVVVVAVIVVRLGLLALLGLGLLGLSVVVIVIVIVVRRIIIIVVAVVIGIVIVS
jgi:hypothetical protein